MAYFEIDRPKRKQRPKSEQRRCHRCNASGEMTCFSCGGTGKVATSRNVFGEQQHIRCTGCFGRKTRRCSTCVGSGFVV